MDELLQSYVKKKGIAASFELGRYSALQTQNAINGSALSKLKELVGVLMKLETGLHFKFSDLKGSLRRCCLQFPELRYKMEEARGVTMREPWLLPCFVSVRIPGA